MLTAAFCLAVGLGLVSGWLAVMHAYLYYFRLSLSLSRLCWCDVHVKQLSAGRHKTSAECKRHRREHETNVQQQTFNK